MIKLELPDGTLKEMEDGSTPYAVALSIGEGLAKACFGAILKTDDDEILLDIHTPITKNGQIRIITNRDEESLEIIRHSCAHLMAQAVSELFPFAKSTIGPTTEHGFYYDFDHAPFSEEDLKNIEKKMQEIAKRNLDIERKEISKKDALAMFKDNEYKVEIINELEDGDITVYHQGEWADLCRGPHIKNTQILKAFKLDRSTGAYWRGDAKNKQLQRIYGFAFHEKKQLNKFLHDFEEAKKRDHKKIGKEMDIYMFSDKVGKGLPLWLPNGHIIKEEIEQLAKEKEHEAGFMRVSTPHLAKQELYLTSGHLPYYEEGMYPKMEMDDGTYYLRGMNCPHHHMIYKHRPKSYKELPYRLAEHGTCYRNELSGTLSGLLRVRSLCQNDAHIYCTKEQIEKEIRSVLEMMEDYFKLFGFENYYYRLSLWDPEHTEKYIDQPDNWQYSQDVLRNVLVDMKLNFKEVKDEAAFYGPKIDIQFKTVLGREETMSTVQLDFLAKSRFELEYMDETGSENNEVFVIHRAPLSTHERFVAFIIEHYGGKFPLWLNPHQIKVLPVSDKFMDYASQIEKEFRKTGFRVKLDSDTSSISKKIRNAQLERYNYMIVIGEKEEETKTITVRHRSGKNENEVDVRKFIDQITQIRNSRTEE